MRAWPLLIGIVGCVAPDVAPSRSARTTGGEAWVELGTIDVSGVRAAHFHPSGYLVAGADAGLVRIDLDGAVTVLAPDVPVTAVFPTEDAVFFSDEDDGVVSRYANGAAMAWSFSFHDGDDDPAGMADAEVVGNPGWSGLLVTDRGTAGPDEVWAVPTDVAASESLALPDDGLFRDAVDVATRPGQVVLADAGAGSPGRVVQWRDGAVSVLVDNLDGPTGIAWDPVSGAWLARDGDAVLEVSASDGFTAVCLADLPDASGVATVDVRTAGDAMVLTLDGAVRVYGRCGAGAPLIADCDDSGINDVCEVWDGTLADCDGDGTPDTCQPASVEAVDCDCDGLFDGCDATCSDADGDGAGEGEPNTGCAVAVDVCPGRADDQSDRDGDGIGDACDPCTDADGDGFGDATLPARTCEADCDDTSAVVFPGAPEAPYDGVDQDCNGADRCDVDGDGHDAIACGGDDCDDRDPARFGGADEIPDDGIDQDCDPGNDVGCGCSSGATGPWWLGLLLAYACAATTRSRPARPRRT